MAQKIFKGFKQELEGQFTAETGYLYFVRDEANTGKTDGYILFNGRKYGTSLAAVNYLEGLIGELPSGFSSISEWIESNEQVVAEALANLDERVSANTEAIAAISSVTGDFATKTEVGELSGRVDTLEAVSADSRISAIEADYLKSTDKTALEGTIGTLSGRVDTLETNSATKEELGTLSGRVDTIESNLGTVSGRVDDLEAISAGTRLNATEEFITNSAATKEELGTLSGSVETLTGQVETISGVVVNNSDFITNSAATKNDISTLETSLGAVSGRVDNLEAISADTRLQTLEEGVQLVESGDSSVNVSEISNGTQTVSVNISNANYNALELDETNGGLYVAQILYDGDDSDVD